MKPTQVLALLATFCSLASAVALPDAVAEAGDLATAEHRLQPRASIPEELFGQILDFEIEATIKAIINIIKLPAKEEAFDKQTPTNIVKNFWKRGYIVAAFCSKNFAGCTNCKWREYKVGGDQGDACGVVGLPGSFIHQGPGGYVNWGYAWPDKLTSCTRQTQPGQKTVVNCVYLGVGGSIEQGKANSLPATTVISSS